MKVLVLTNDTTDEFLDVVTTETDLINWAEKWILKDDRNIDFHEGGAINLNDNKTELIISGDNGVVFINVKEFNL